MILEFDLGNTRGKWRLLHDSSVLARGLVEDDAPQGLASPAAVERARAISVADFKRNARLADWVAINCGCELQFAQSSLSCAGVISGYTEPERLGVDRWAALVAAHVEARTAVLVVDAGTAMTLDIVMANGQHRGGWIVPGRTVALRGLIGHTAQIRVEPCTVSSLAPGQTTSEAVNHGVAMAAIGAIAKAVEYLPPQAVGYLTGGDADWLAPNLPPIGGGWRRREELVMDGLAHILPTIG